VITLDCNYSPVERVAYQVENTRVGSATDYEKLILTIVTNATNSADAVLGEGAAELKRYLNWITDKQSAMMSYIPLEEPVNAGARPSRNVRGRPGALGRATTACATPRSRRWANWSVLARAANGH
jgi:hypothetical protein